MSDMLSDKFSGLPNATTQYALARDACEGGSDPTELLGGSSPKKWGRSSPTWCFARVQIDRRAMRNLLFLVYLLDRQGDREGDAYGDLCISCTLHLPALQVAI